MPPGVTVGGGVRKLILGENQQDGILHTSLIFQYFKMKCQLSNETFDKIRRIEIVFAPEWLSMTIVLDEPKIKRRQGARCSSEMER